MRLEPLLFLLPKMLVRLYFLILVNLNLVLVCDMLLFLSSSNVHLCLVGILSWEYHYLYTYIPLRISQIGSSLPAVFVVWKPPRGGLCTGHNGYSQRDARGWKYDVWWWWWWWWWWSSLLHYLGCTDCLSREKGAMIIVKGWWNDDTPE